MTLSQINSAGIADGSIVNADINSSAAIALSKLASTPAVLTGSTNNTIATVSGANALTGEANLTFDGSNLAINGSPPWTVTGGNWRNLSISGEGAGASGFLWLGNGAAATNADHDLARINVCNGPTIVAQIAGSTQTSANDDGRISFHTQATGGTLTERLRIDSSGDLTANTGNLKFTAADKSILFNNKFYLQDSSDSNKIRLWIDSNSSSETKGATWITGVGDRSSVNNLDENHAGLLVFPSGTEGSSNYSDRHMITFSQPETSWYEPSGTAHTSFGLLWHYVASNSAQNRCGIVYDHHNTEEFRFYNTYGPTVFYSYPGTTSQGDRTVNQCDEAFRICKSGVVSIHANPTNNFGGVSNGSNNVSANQCRLNVHGGIRVTDYHSNGGHSNNSAVQMSSAIYDPLNPSNYDRGQNVQGDAYFTMGWKTTCRSGEVMHRKTDGDLYKKPGGTAVHAYYIEAGVGEAGGICLDEDSVNVYGSSDSGTTFRICDKDSDIVAAEMTQSSWNWNVRGNVNGGASVSSLSDRRLKKSIQDSTPTTEILSKYGQIKLKSFIRIDQYDYVKKKYTNEEDLREVGVIAQEIESIFPDCVGESKNIDKKSYKSVYEELGLEGDDQFDTIKNVNVNGILYKTIEAIQELIKENESFKSRITALES